LWIIVPVASFVWLTLDVRNVETTPNITVSVPVQVNDTPYERLAELSLTWREDTPLFSPDWDGVVQSFAVSPGDVISSGDPLGVIGGVKRFLCHSTVPLSGDVTASSSGEEIQVVNEFLAHQGFPTDASSTSFGRGTYDAISKFSRLIGTAEDEVFRSEWIVYLPWDDYRVSAVNMFVGALAPSQGTPILSGVPTLVSAELESHVSGGVPNGPATPLVAGTGERLFINDTEFLLADDRRTVRAESLGSLADQVGSADNSTVTVSLLSEPSADEMLVPSSAVFVSTTGAVCVAIDSSPPRGVVVVVRGNVGGNTIVTGDLHQTDSVVIAPEMARRTC